MTSLGIFITQSKGHTHRDSVKRVKKLQLHNEVELQKSSYRNIDYWLTESLSDSEGLDDPIGNHELDVTLRAEDDHEVQDDGLTSNKRGITMLSR